MKSSSSFVLAFAFAVAACGGATSSTENTTPPPGSSSSGTPVTQPPTNAADAPQCDASAASDIAVASDDPNGYAPYSIAECSLVYVSSAGELVLRDLVTKAEIKIAPAAEKPRRPSVTIDMDGGGSAASAVRHLLIAWEATLAPGPVVRVRYGDTTTTMQGDFVMAGEPRARDRFVTFTAWKGGAANADTDVWLYDARTADATTAKLVLGGEGQQRFADVSSTHVVASDLSEDAKKAFDPLLGSLSDIIVYEIASGTVTRRPAPGKQAFPMLSSTNALAYLEWPEVGVHPQPKLQSYDLKAGSLNGPPTFDRKIAHVEYRSQEPARPAWAGEMLEWIAGNGASDTGLYRARADGAAPPTLVGGLDNLFLYAPAPRIAAGASAGFTVIGAIDSRSSSSTPMLRAVGR